MSGNTIMTVYTMQGITSTEQYLHIEWKAIWLESQINSQEA